MPLVTMIDPEEEFTRDWDWYACDVDGHLGHFASAGLRALPHSVKMDRDTAERLARYFFDEAQDRTGYTVRPEAEADAGGWQKPGARERFLKSFIEMARKGAFSYNTQMLHGRAASYYLVAKPEIPLFVTDLPHEIADVVRRTRAPFSFATTDYVPEVATLLW